MDKNLTEDLTGTAQVDLNRLDATVNGMQDTWMLWVVLLCGSTMSITEKHQTLCRNVCHVKSFRI